MRRASALVLVLSLVSGCGHRLSVIPDPSPRVLPAVYEGRPGYVRDGVFYDRAQLNEAVEGNPAAAEAAASSTFWQGTSIAGLVIGPLLVIPLMNPDLFKSPVPEVAVFSAIVSLAVAAVALPYSESQRNRAVQLYNEPFPAPAVETAKD